MAQIWDPKDGSIHTNPAGGALVLATEVLGWSDTCELVSQGAREALDAGAGDEGRHARRFRFAIVDRKTTKTKVLPRTLLVTSS